jgi:hypothetical protein|tara:strand:- start:41 stop:349 length:309 start_codon:yes stop_codon:yes gene_type:complete
MAFNNYTSLAIGTSAATVHTIASNKEAVVIGLNLANITTGTIKVTVTIAGAHVVKNTPIPAGAALSVLDGKIIMETTDTCVVTSDTASSVDALLSVLEQDES